LDRVKRATTDDDENDNDVDENSDVPGPRVSDDSLTYTDNVTAPPDAPLHQNTPWPTPNGKTLQGATDLCTDALKATPLYDSCRIFGAADEDSFVQSCVADIKVTTCRLDLGMFTTKKKPTDQTKECQTAASKFVN